MAGGFSDKGRYTPSGSRSAGANRTAQNKKDIEEATKRAKAAGDTNIHVEYDRIPGQAGTTAGVYSNAAKRRVSRASGSQGSHKRRTPREEEPGFDPRTMGNRRFGKGATAPFSRSNATKRVSLDSKFAGKSGSIDLMGAALRRIGAAASGNAANPGMAGRRKRNAKARQEAENVRTSNYAKGGAH
jgi:hypothetical protein